ncbi:PREDICTED: CD63 antigen isoform X1 [Capra hircus]|uniref:CD63 antigen n=1 Tax=Capra hircus TaxID=9925 RepID=A0A8C2N8C5_CAPHI|nr:PREDICTED: CD63 antigen isoform X1 [Capra hircus]XP_017903609.1 PREDICTED: CD63 antigen isoform X1 [Capra hircus]
MAVEGGMKCVKFLLYVLLLAFCACAVGLIAVGVATQLVLNQTMTRGATPSFLLPVVIIAVGAFLFLVAFVGCCGACKENYCLMITFAIFLSLIMLVEVAAAIAGYVFRDKVRSEFNKDFRQQMKNYPKANETASILDKMQKDFKCCGAANYTDWEKIPTMASRVPDSCCVNITNNCGVHFVVKDIHTEGCVEKIAAWLRKNVLVVAAAALGIAFVEVRGTLGHLGTRGSGRVLSRGLVCGGEPWLSLGSLSCLPDSSSPPSLSVLLDPGYCLSMLPCEEHPKWL